MPRDRDLHNANTLQPPHREPIPATIPSALRDHYQWVCWRYEERGGKRTKVPYNPNSPERTASTSDPRSWASLERALEQMENARLDGVGFVFTESDPFVGIDLDDCFQEDGNIHEWAMEVLEQALSYTEVTPSGRGLHVIARGRLPGSGRRKGPIEMYDRGRYFTVTGDHFSGTSRLVESRHTEIEALYSRLFEEPSAAAGAPVPSRPPAAIALDDSALLARAMSARNGAAFSALWRGETGGHESQSEADLALCCSLAFWTGGDAARVDALFRQSGLFRAEKWDQKHYGDGKRYGQATVAKALSLTHDHYTPRRAGQLLTEPVEAPMAGTEERPVMPALSPASTDIYEFLSPRAGRWLDRYIEFAARAAPMTPRSFHEAAGLFTASVIIARRLRLKVSTQSIYPNLFILFIAPSTLYSKTSGMKVMLDLFDRADLRHHLLPQRMTPEAMMQELSLTPPQYLAQADEATREMWLRERAFAAKRGWALDEASALFDSLKRDYNTGLLGMILNLYECPSMLTEQTVGRWRLTVRDAYLSFFGATTPASMATHLANHAHWANGLWARFALIVPDQPPVWEFFPQDTIPFPAELVEGLRGLATLFPSPTAELLDEESSDGTKRKVVRIEGEEEAAPVLLEHGVWEAWKRYTWNTRYELLTQGQIAPELQSSYGRLGIHAIKVAMLLAALDAGSLPVRVSLAHYARAQQIVEGWRASIHMLSEGMAVRDSAREIDRIMELLDRAGAEGVTTRTVYRTLHLETDVARNRLEELSRQGLIEPCLATTPSGRQLEVWRRRVG